MTEARAVKEIRKAASRRARSLEAHRKVTDELRRVCAEARDEGIPVSQIAQEAGLSRQGVYDLLAQRPS